MPTIQICNVSKRYEQTQVLSDVSLSLGHGERWALLGKSGIGKTTLLRILCGLEQADSGQLLIDSCDVTGQPPHLRQSALVTQDYPLYPHLTVEQNLRAAVQSCRLKGAESQSRVDQALSWFQIGELRERLPSQLSGGQAQRVALARALIRRPALLLLDEPLSQVDGLWRAEIRELILASVEQFASNLIVVTHDPHDALLMADHIAVLDQQSIVQHGEALEVYQRPFTRRAAELLSPFGVNWFVATELRPEAFDPPLEIPADKSFLGIRVEQVRVFDGKPDLGIQTFNADIQHVRHCGFATLGTATLSVDTTSSSNQLPERRGMQSLQILDWNNSLRPGRAQLAVLREQCIWV